LPKQSSQSEMRCSQMERLLHCTHLIRFFILLPMQKSHLFHVDNLHRLKVLGCVGALLYLISVEEL